MKVTMLLADSAQAVGGKLYILGGGWSITGPMPSPSAIALKIEVPWDLAARRHNILLELVDADGQPIRLPTPQGEQPVRAEAGACQEEVTVRTVAWKSIKGTKLKCNHIPIKNFTTKVPAKQSIAEIQDALVKHSAMGVLYKYEQGTGRIEALQFL